jgi:hypothetical protein
MELDEIKDLLNQKLETNHLHRSEADFAALLTKKANSVLAKIQKSLWFEIISAIVITIAFALIAFTSKYESIKIYFSVFTFVFIPFTIVFIFLLKKTSTIDNNLPVKSNLLSIVNILEEFMKRYFQFTMALIPICLVFSFALGYTEKEPIHFMDNLITAYKPTFSLVLVFTFVYVIGLVVGVYYFTKWYLKKMYGKYVAELKNYINELNN